MSRRLEIAAVVWMIALGCWACQPKALKESEVTATTPADAATSEISSAADGQGSSDVSQADPGAAGDSDAAVTPECSKDQECAAMATPCQLASCNKGACVLTQKPATAACDDGNPCTVGDACDDKGICQKGLKPTDCDDKNVCTADTCDPKTLGGCVNTPMDGGTCDDKDPCTTGESCKNGACVGGTDKCLDCKVDKDCEAKQNVCTGAMACDKSKGAPYTCKSTSTVNPCPDDNPKDCMESKCDPTAPDDSKCKSAPKADGATCDDGISCSTGDSCKAGVCTFKSEQCACLTDQECVEAAGATNFKCSGKYTCDTQNGYVCKKLPSTVCNSSGDTPCVVNTCDETTGKCGPAPVKKYPIACDDGNGCTTGDVCEKTVAGIFTGVCESGTNICKCGKDADCASKEDGDVCNGTLFCNKVTGDCQVNPASVVVCATALDSVCLKTLCNKKTGICESVPTERLKTECPIGKPDCGIYVKLDDAASSVSVPCDDGNKCTASSSCKAGQCFTEKSSFTCTCGQDADCANLGDKCGGTFMCNKASGKCELNPATVVVCPTVSDTQCAKNLCDNTTGLCVMTPVDKGPAYAPCEDGNPCTKFDFCSSGQCVSGPSTCLCLADADCGKVEDGDPCNGTMFCNKATQKCENNPSTVVNCPSTFDTPCTKNKCNKSTGACEMVAQSNLVGCDDGNFCTEGDVCIDGSCQSGTYLCVCTNNADCAKQEDGNLCNGTLYCDMSAPPFQCKVNPITKIVCPSAQDTPCITNTCDIATGTCAMKPNPKLWAPCDDGNNCTASDVCVAGECKSGTNKCECNLDADCAKYDDQNDCNGKLACLDIGGAKICGVNPVSVITCQGGSDCSKNVCDPATASCKIVAVPQACNDNNPCTLDMCETGNCSHTNAVENTPCSAGATPKTCQAGVCK